MQITNKFNDNNLNLRVILNWIDWKRLVNGEIIGDRYNGESKIAFYNLNRFRGVPEFVDREHAVLNRSSLDIDVFIPECVLQDCRIVASKFSRALKNLTGLIDDNPLEIALRVEYPGSLKVIDVPAYSYGDS
jgi:hypothetical protein